MATNDASGLKKVHRRNSLNLTAATITGSYALPQRHAFCTIGVSMDACLIGTLRRAVRYSQCTLDNHMVRGVARRARMDADAISNRALSLAAGIHVISLTSSRV